MASSVQGDGRASMSWKASVKHKERSYGHDFKGYVISLSIYIYMYTYLF